MAKLSKYAPFLAVASTLTAGCVPNEPRGKSAAIDIKYAATASVHMRDNVKQCVEGDVGNREMLGVLRATMDKYLEMGSAEFVRKFKSPSEFMSVLSKELFTYAMQLPATDIIGLQCARIRGNEISNVPTVDISKRWATKIYNSRVANEKFGGNY